MKAQLQQLRGPKVSAIMIFLNGEAFIAEAIDSILAQSLTDWELILVDDGSTDAATAIARAYAEQHPERIRYTDHPGHANRGMSASRNLGIALARGDYVAFLDADDVWLPRRLAVHAEILDRRADVHMVMGPTLWWESWPYPEGSWQRKWLDSPRVQGLPANRAIPAPEVALSFLTSGGTSLCGIGSLTARRESVLAVGGFNDDFRTLYEDQVFEFRFCLRFSVWVTDEILDKYRQHPDSACNAAGRVNGDLAMRPTFLAWLEQHLQVVGCEDERIWRAFRSEKRRFEDPAGWWCSALPRRAGRWLQYKQKRISHLIWVLPGRGGLP